MIDSSKADELDESEGEQQEERRKKDGRFRSPGSDVMDFCFCSK